MGVYIFKSFHGSFIKVGHYKGKNAFCRISHRGFYSCLCPKEIRDKVSMEDVELLAWFPNLQKPTERLVKHKWRAHRIYRKSEWFPLEVLHDIQSFLETLDQNRVHTCDPFEAMLSNRRI